MLIRYLPALQLALTSLIVGALYLPTPLRGVMGIFHLYCRTLHLSQCGRPAVFLRRSTLIPIVFTIVS